MRFKMVHFNIKMQDLELVNLKYVTYAQPILPSLRGLAEEVTDLLTVLWF